MEEKKFDPYQFIGFILIALILTWMLYRNGPTDVEKSNQQTNTEQAFQKNTNYQNTSTQSDSIIQQQKVTAYGDLGILFTANDQPIITFETEQFDLELNPKGGQISKLTLNGYENFEDSV